MLKDRQADSAAESLLTENGVPVQVANSVLNSFNGNSEFYAFTFTDLKAIDSQVNHVMFIRYDALTFKLRTFMDDEVDYTMFENTTYRAFVSEIHDMLSKIGTIEMEFK